MNILFFRGLNTYGDDLLHIGPLSFGPAYGNLQKTFTDKNISFTPILNMGHGRLREQAENAKESILSMGVLGNNQKNKFHILAHSTGGLVARQFLSDFPELNNHFISLTTLATPHLGTLVAEKALNFKDISKIKYQTCKSLGYDAQKKEDSYIDLTKEACEKFNTINKTHELLPMATVSFGLPQNELSWPAKLLHRTIYSKENILTDGLLETEQQAFAEHLGTFGLDHISQLGRFFYFSNNKKNQSKEEFDKLCNTLVNFWQQSES